jgi:hypothetical protein
VRYTHCSHQIGDFFIYLARELYFNQSFEFNKAWLTFKFIVKRIEPCIS